MSDKIIELKKLPSGSTAIVLETKTGMAIEVGSGRIFFEIEDLYDFIRLLKATDKHFLKKRK